MIAELVTDRTLDIELNNSDIDTLAVILDHYLIPGRHLEEKAEDMAVALIKTITGETR